MKKIIAISLSVCVVLSVSSCATYHMTREELYNQITDADRRDVTTSHAMPLGSRTYTSNGVEVIKCTDKKGNEVSFPNSPQVEMRITDTRNKKHMFYFDTINLQDSVFTGMNSRILGTRKSVKFADIRKVELQKGAKKYHYK